MLRKKIGRAYPPRFTPSDNYMKNHLGFKKKLLKKTLKSGDRIIVKAGGNLVGDFLGSKPVPEIKSFLEGDSKLVI